MNVLITGGYGFIGSHLARRFHKEGHKVHIIDNLSSPVQTTLNFKHKFYRLDVKDSKCQEIFGGVSFDRVIHLAEGEKDYLIDNLKAITDLVIRYKVPKFIYLSSTDLYDQTKEEGAVEGDGLHPKNLKEIEWMAAENYLELCRQNHQVQMQCLRVSTVYGKQSKAFLNRRGKEAKKILRDYIYIGDVVDAIYKASEFSTSSVLNICSYSLCNGEIGEKGVYLTQKGYSNEKAIYELNWVPRHKLTDKLSEEWLEEENVSEGETESPKKKKNLRKLLPYVENIISFGVIILLINVFRNYHITPLIDLALVYVAIISILYGLNQSIIAVSLSCVLYIASHLVNGQNVVALVYDPNTLLNLGLYIFVGTVLGYVIDNKKYELEEKEREHIELKEKFKFIYELYKEMTEEKKALEYQIATNEESFGKVYKVITRLDSLSPAKIFNGAIEVIQQLVKVKSVAIYMNSTNSSFMRLISHSHELVNIPHSVNLVEWEKAYQELSNNRIYTNTVLDSEMPSVMAPIMMDGKIMAVVCFYDVAFERLNLQMKNLIHITCNLVTASLVKAYRYEQAIWNKKYIDSTSVLRAEYFEKVLMNRWECMEKGISEYVLLQIHHSFDLETYEKLKSSIREVDYLGVNEAKEIFLILSNTNPIGAQFVIERLEKKAVKATIETEEAYFKGKSPLGGIAL